MGAATNVGVVPLGRKLSRALGGTDALTLLWIRLQFHAYNILNRFY